MFKRKIAVIKNNGQVFVREEGVPELKENEVLIKVHSSLISPGTEMLTVKALREKEKLENEDLPFGYANAGEVVKIKGNCKNIKKGMRVACMGGHAQHATYTCVPINMLIPIPDNVTYQQGVYACLAATSLQAIRRSEPQLGEYAVILGLGIVGNICSQLSQLSGARIIAWEGMEPRIKIAGKCNIKDILNFKNKDCESKTKEFLAPYGADFSIFAFGGQGKGAFDSILACMKVSSDGHQMGRIVLVGGCEVRFSGGAYTGNIDVKSSSRTGPGYHDPVYEYGEDYPNAFIQFTTQRNLKEIIQLISEKRLIVDPMTTHIMPLAKVNDAADLLIDTPENALGIILEMNN